MARQSYAFPQARPDRCADGCPHHEIGPECLRDDGFARQGHQRRITAEERSRPQSESTVSSVDYQRGILSELSSGGR
jgi:hypothetical protein